MTKEIERLYGMMRLAHYRQLFARVKEKPGSLSATEAFSAEIIYLLGEPTVGEFAEFVSISQPNASYKVGALVAKGYICRLTEGADRRETRLRVTEKFHNYYNVSAETLSRLTRDVNEKFTQEERALITRFINYVSADMSENGGKEYGLV